jgi:DNA-binding CsgD family transcriptional regulator
VPFPAPFERSVTTLATRASVRLAQLGVGAVTQVPPRLTVRQHEIARLVVLGDTNAEVGRKLAISANTVKAQLKDIFERLALRSRVELVTALARQTPPLGVPAGITRLGGITITRAPQ